MSRTKGTLGLSSNIEPSMNAPLDGRETVNLLTDLTASASFPYFYEGMQVYVKENKKTYKLIGENPTAAASWEEVGAGTEITIDSAPTSGSTNAVSSGGVYNSLGGKADLVDGKIPASQLPAGFDNYDEYNSQSAFPVTGESDKIYVAKDTNLTYRWTGSAYVTVGGSDLALGETSSTAYRGDRGKIAYEDSQTNKASIGVLANLATTVKTSLVAAINEIKNSLTSVATSGSFNDLVNRPTKDVTAIDTITPLPETPIKLLTVANKIDKANIYSTTEQIVGQWTDGKPLYQKVINFGALPNATTKSIEHGISNIGTVVSCEGVGYGANSSWMFPIPYNSPTQLNGQVALYMEPTKVSIQTAANKSSESAYIIIKYTKTTDSAMPVGTDTDYSTSEKIVGSWIDGKPLYQKTINFGALPNSGTKAVSTGVSNISFITSITGVAYNSGGGGNIYPFPMTYNDAVNKQLKIDWNSSTNNIEVFSSVDWSTYSAYITIQYTKTTD